MTTVSKPKRNPAKADVSDQKKMRYFKGEMEVVELLAGDPKTWEVGAGMSRGNNRRMEGAVGPIVSSARRGLTDPNTVNYRGLSRRR